jgi:hypothetical protein
MHTPIIDQYSDPAMGTLAHSLRDLPSLSEFVKTANIDSHEADALPSSAFAWPDERKFPLHTAEHAALSFTYFQKTSSAVPPYVGTAIQNALEVYGVTPELFVSTKVAAATAEKRYLLPELGLFEVKTAADVLPAQKSLVDQMERLPLEQRATACINLMKYASESSVKLDPMVLQLAGFVVSSTKVARQWLEARATACPDDKAAQKLGYQTLADGLSRMPEESVDRPGLLKVANAIATLDEQSGLDRFYDRKLPDPLKTVFNTTKLASDMVDVDGTMVSMSKLSALPASFWEDLGGREMSDEVCPGGRTDRSKLADVVATLPLDLKRVLKAQVR